MAAVDDAVPVAEPLDEPDDVDCADAVPVALAEGVAENVATDVAELVADPVAVGAVLDEEEDVADSVAAAVIVLELVPLAEAVAVATADAVALPLAVSVALPDEVAVTELDAIKHTLDAVSHVGYAGQQSPLVIHCTHTLLLPQTDVFAPFVTTPTHSAFPWILSHAVEVRRREKGHLGGELAGAQAPHIWRGRQQRHKQQ